MSQLVLLAVLPLAIIVTGVSIQGKISLAEKLGIPKQFDQSLFLADGRVMVHSSGKEISRTSVSKSGSFGFDIEKGNYKIYFSHPFLRFDPIAITVTNDTGVTAYKFDPVRPSLDTPISLPLNIAPIGYQSPYTQVEEFNAWQIFKNPMVIMGLVMVVLVWLMPKLQGTMDPEEMKEMRKELESDSGFTANILKKMIPTNIDNSGGINLPSLSSDAGEDKKRK